MRSPHRNWLTKHILVLLLYFSASTTLADLENIAPNAEVSTSSTENASLNGEAAIDGNGTTRWASAYDDNESIQFDLGYEFDISHVVLDWEEAYAKVYAVEVSTNGNEWRTVYETSQGTGASEEITLDTTARFVKINCLERATEWGFSLWEVEIFGEPTTNNNTNIAQNKPVTASSIETNELSASMAVDGSQQTRWASEEKLENQWLSVDLIDTYRIESIELNWEAAYASAYEIQTSLDNSQWTTVYSQYNGDGDLDSIDKLSTEARYVRMMGIERGTEWGLSLWEFQIFGELVDGSGPTPTFTPTPTPTPSPSPTPEGNIALNKTAYASTIESAELDAHYAFDGALNSRWASEEGLDNQWLYVDLGQRYPIQKIVLHWEAAYASAYDIQVSDDAVNWQNIYSTNSGAGGSNTLTNLNGEGRYVRLLGRQRGTDWGFSLWDLEVYSQDNDGDGNGQQLVWEDEFNTIDLSSWTYQIGDIGNGWGNDELQYYTNGENTFIEYDDEINKNVLVIEARKENPGNRQCWYGSCQYTSARMMTLGKKEFMYGRIEARLKLPDTPGIWPAFWALGTNMNQVGWPQSGEFDIMEHVGLNPTYTWGALHAPGFAGDGTPLTQHFDHGHVVNQHYHVYAVEWDENGFTWFVDDQEFYRVTRAEVEAKGEWVFSHNFYILLNIAVGGSWPGTPNNASQFPQRMYVDYVRVYQ